MAARRRNRKAEKDLSERQRFWLKHLRSAERKDEPLNAYAERHGLSESSLYEAKRRLRACGVIAPSRQQRTAPPEFVRVEVAGSGKTPASLRVRLASGALLEWSEAPQGDALRELIGLVS